MEENKKFENVTTSVELINVLETWALVQHNTHSNAIRYVCHYTSMDAITAIMKSKRWYIGSPKNMNDGLELIHLNDARSDNLFFASFCLDNHENIGMWSMYAQPWEKGVILRIPVEKFKSWIKSGCKIYSADKMDKTSRSELLGAILSVHAVAYSNSESKDPKDDEMLTCGSQRNKHFHYTPEKTELKGYIKDIAWEYEKEYRIRVETAPDDMPEAVCIEIPDDVINSFEFITGPRYSQNFKLLLRNSVDESLNPIVKESLFTGRLKWTFCDSCRNNGR